MDLLILSNSLRQVHESALYHSQKQVNFYLTLRNWLIGYYIAYYQLNGEDRAEYGEKLFETLESDLGDIKGINRSSLYRFLQFYETYPQIVSVVAERFQLSEIDKKQIVATLSRQLLSHENQDDGILATASRESGSIQNQLEEIREKLSSGSTQLPPEVLIDKLSFSHFLELILEQDPLKRNFYEVQSVKNNWSVRDLKRARNTLMADRTALSTDYEKAIESFKQAKPQNAAQLIKQPFVLEFLQLAEKPSFSENDLEEAIINHLQDFIMEMGRGFCFEARQKRISFDNKHYRIDLVFYHRILKCHVLIDLKLGAFDHADAGQMNLYLNYFKAEEMEESDNPPVGIILCAEKNDTLVKYATGGLSEELFVGKYLTQLPNAEQLKMIVDAETQKLKGHE